jgi:Predicted membrane protein (DUF2207) C-terminal domain
MVEVIRRIQLVQWAVPLVGYLVVLGWLTLSRPRLPQPGPPVADLGAEPPAVVALLMNGWEVDEHALAATLLDLAARRYIEVEEPGDGIRIRLLYPDPSGLIAPERLVHDLIRSRAGLGQSVPLAAIVPDGHSAAQDFRRRFEAATVQAARGMRLSTRRPGEAMANFSFFWFAVIPAFFAALLPAALIAVWMRSAYWLLVAPVLWIALIILLRLPFKAALMRHEWSTPDGRRTARYWLGVKAFLDGYEVFHDLPPSAVMIWDRYLAYGAALRCTERATDALAVVWTGRHGTARRETPVRPIGTAPARQPRSPAELTSPNAVRVGMITVLDGTVVTPAGSWPRSGTQWTVTETRHSRLSVNVSVLIVFVGMCCLFPVTLVLVPAMFGRRVAGTVAVTVSWMGISFTTELPYVGKDEYAAITGAVTAATGYPRASAPAGQ